MWPVSKDMLTGCTEVATGSMQHALYLTFVLMIHLFTPLTSETQKTFWKSESHGEQTAKVDFVKAFERLYYIMNYA